jgi:chromosome segregation ATPase
MSNSHDEPDSHMDDIKQSIKLLTQLALRAGERMDDLEEAQANSERKIAALADAQIRTEDSLARLSEAQSRTEEAQANSERKIASLIDAQQHTEENVAKLSQAQQRTEESITRLSIVVERLGEKMLDSAAAQAHSDQRLDALIDIVREKLGGQPQG